jgi:hypothetical protein
LIFVLLVASIIAIVSLVWRAMSPRDCTVWQR